MITDNFEDFIRERFLLLMELTTLPDKKFLEITKISSSHFYNIKNQKKAVTVAAMERLGNFLDLPLVRVYDPKCDLKKYAKITESLRELLEEVVRENEKNSSSASRFIEAHLLSSSIFDYPVSVAEVRDECLDVFGKKYSSHAVATALGVLANMGKLEKSRMPILKEDGSRGARMINYFSRPQPKKKTS